MTTAKKNNEDETEWHMRQVLEHEGFQVDRIPSRSTKTADFRVSDEDDKYLIEVKRREDDPEKLEQFEREFLQNGAATRTEPSGRTDAIQRSMREATKQLEATPTVTGEFRLIWFAAWGDCPQLQMDQFRSTLYGEVEVAVRRTGRDRRSIPCFYYTFSEFYKLRHIDGAVASSETRGGLYINTFSPNADALRRTKLFRMYNGSGAVCDPIALEARGDALIFDLDTDRRDKGAVYLGLCQKYQFGIGDLLPFFGDDVIYRIGLTARSESGKSVKSADE